MTRWVKVADMHVAEGIEGRFFYRRGKETRTQMAVSLGGGAWEVGGWATEAYDRGSSRMIRKLGPYHRRLYAQYEYRVYRRCFRYVGCERRWRPRIWTGALTRGAFTLAQVYDPYHMIGLGLGHTFETENAGNRVYRAGVVIKGLGLDSQAGYSTITKLVWTGVGCAERWLSGDGRWPSEAPVVYSWSRAC